MGQKKSQVRANLVRNNLAHSFDFTADAEVKAENNRIVTEPEFRQRLAELASFIEDKFGARHPVANRRRVPTR